MPYVLDASIALGWCFKDEAAANDPRVLKRITDEGVVVPAIWLFEVANVLVISMRSGRLDELEMRQFVTLLQGLDISIDELSFDLAFTEILELGVSIGLTAYDASYVELAKRVGFQLVTSDQKMIQAAEAVGVSIFTP